MGPCAAVPNKSSEGVSHFQRQCHKVRTAMSTLLTNTRKIEEHFESTSDHSVGGIMLDIYSDVGWVMI